MTDRIRTHRDNGSCELVITDTGHGVSEQDAPLIFTPFFSTKEKGRGLGLSSAYSIVKRHGGILTVDSVPGRGSTFRLFLPASDRDPEHGPATTGASARRSGRVLIMDDDPAVRDVLSSMLADVGYEVVTVDEGHSCVQLYADARRMGRRLEVRVRRRLAGL